MVDTDDHEVVVRLVGSLDTRVTLRQEEASELLQVLLQRTTWERAELPWNPMRRYAGVEVEYDDTQLRAWAGRLVDKQEKLAWYAPELEDRLLGALLDAGHGEALKAALGRVRWMRLTRHHARRRDSS